ncbi:MAG: ABC transporter permease subunit [Azospirillaceae bacterium]|nr:ABC transporter permease subunit [Azospirillaceae bacterium]
MLNLHGYGAQLAQGAATTLMVAFTTLAVGLVLGLLGAAAKLSPRFWLREPVSLITNLLRGVPEFVILLICYFGLTNFLSDELDSDIEISPFVGGVIALSLVFGAYASEAFRGAFLAVPKGQIEAARAFGMPRVRIFFRIHLPQAWRFALPSLNNQWQTLLKDTCLVSVIGLEEIMRKANIAAQVTKAPFNFYLAVALIYLVFLGGSVPVFRALERRANRGVRPA